MLYRGAAQLRRFVRNSHQRRAIDISPQASSSLWNISNVVWARQEESYRQKPYWRAAFQKTKYINPCSNPPPKKFIVCLRDTGEKWREGVKGCLEDFKNLPFWLGRASKGDDFILYQIDSEDGWMKERWPLPIYFATIQAEEGVGGGCKIFMGRWSDWIWLFSPSHLTAQWGTKTNALQADKCLNRSLYLVVRCMLALQICLIID